MHYTQGPPGTRFAEQAAGDTLWELRWRVAPGILEKVPPWLSQLCAFCKSRSTATSSIELKRGHIAGAEHQHSAIQTEPCCAVGQALVPKKKKREMGVEAGTSVRKKEQCKSCFKAPRRKGHSESAF